MCDNVMYVRHEIIHSCVSRQISCQKGEKLAACNPALNLPSHRSLDVRPSRVRHALVASAILLPSLARECRASAVARLVTQSSEAIV